MPLLSGGLGALGVVTATFLVEETGRWDGERTLSVRPFGGVFALVCCRKNMQKLCFEGECGKLYVWLSLLGSGDLFACFLKGLEWGSLMFWEGNACRCS